MSGLQPVIDLRRRFEGVRDQGTRPTCVALATSDVHAAVRGDHRPLSCEYLFFKAQEREGRRATQGASVKAALEVLTDHGQPAEVAWPYRPLLDDEETWAPPPSCGELYRRGGELLSANVDTVISLLNEKRPVIMLLTLSDAFFSPVAGVVEVTDSEMEICRHAVVAVAHGALPHGRAVLVRNSWGPEWGLQGHAWVQETYLSARLKHIAVLEE